MILFKSPAEVRARLPLVVSIVKDITAFYPSVSAALDEATQAKYAIDGDLRILKDSEARDRFEVIQNYIDEIEKLGGHVRNAEYGLVDFLGKYDNRRIEYCWCLGEADINFYHPVNCKCSNRISINGQIKVIPFPGSGYLEK